MVGRARPWHVEPAVRRRARTARTTAAARGRPTAAPPTGSAGASVRRPSGRPRRSARPRHRGPTRATRPPNVGPEQSHLPADRAHAAGTPFRNTGGASISVVVSRAVRPQREATALSFSFLVFLRPDKKTRTKKSQQI